MTFLEHLNDVALSDQRVAYAIFLEKPQRHATARAAITYGVKVVLPFDYGVDEAIVVALL